MSSNVPELLRRIADLSKRANLIVTERLSAPEEERNLTDVEIESIVNEIVSPVCRVERIRKQIHETEKDILREALKNKSVKINSNAIPKLKREVRINSLKGVVAGGTPQGMNASDDLGANSTQTTLSTRRKAGSRQNVAGGQRAQREIATLSSRNTPAVLLVFDKQETFYTIMDKWRRKIVNLHISDLISTIEVLERTEDPYWYETARKILKTEIYQGDYYLKLILRKEILYTFRIDINTIPDLIMANIGVINLVSVVYSPITRGEIEIHILPNNKSIIPMKITKKKPLEEEQIDADVGARGILSTNTSKSLYILNSIQEIILNTSINGIDGIKAIYPIKRSLLELVTIDNTSIIIKQDSLRFYNINTDIVSKLVLACGLIIKSSDKTTVTVEMNLSPIIILKLRLSLDAPLRGVKNEEKNKDGTWIVNMQTIEDTELIAKYFSDMDFNFTVTNTTINISVLPKITLKDWILLKQKQDEQEQLDHETRKRSERQEKGEAMSILRPPTAIETASTYYIAETAGGTMYNFLYMRGIDITKSYSNDPREIVQLLGIEAVRTMLIKQIDEIWSNTGTRLSHSTVFTTVDYMTYRGSLTAYSYSGILTNRIGFVAKSTVQTAMRQYQNAALNNETDPLNNAVSSMMVGKLIKMGTGVVQVEHTDIYEKYKEEEIHFEVEDEIRSKYLERGDEENEEEVFREERKEVASTTVRMFSKTGLCK